MKNKYVSNILRFVLMVVLQLLILNNIDFAGFLVPFLYIYFILKLPLKVSKIWVMIFAFIIGLTIDLFTGTFGINAAASTFVGFIRPRAIKLFFGDADPDKDITPSIQEFGTMPFLGYAALLTTIQVFLTLLLEAFSFNQFALTSLRALSCSALSILLIMLIEILMQKIENKGKRRS